MPCQAHDGDFFPQWRGARPRRYPCYTQLRTGRYLPAAEIDPLPPKADGTRAEQQQASGPDNPGDLPREFRFRQVTQGVDAHDTVETAILES